MNLNRLKFETEGRLAAAKLMAKFDTKPSIKDIKKSKNKK